MEEDALRIYCRRSEKSTIFHNHTTSRGFLFIAFPILHYSSTPILSQKDTYLSNSLPRVKKSWALITRFFAVVFENSSSIGSVLKG
jgi:hypothetical protein